MMRIYFVRHGESQANILYEISNRGLRHGLTAKGRKQATALAVRLQDCSITRLYSSPLLRARETGAILADRLGLDYEVADALREFDCGIAEGRADEEAWKLWHWVVDSWIEDKRLDRRIEGGESFLDLRDRFMPFVQGLVDQYGKTGANILCIGHGGLFLTMLPLVLEDFTPIRIAGRRFGPTSCIVAELRADGLYPLEWDGLPIDEVRA